MGRTEVSGFKCAATEEEARRQLLGDIKEIQRLKRAQDPDGPMFDEWYSFYGCEMRFLVGCLNEVRCGLPGLRKEEK